MQNGEAGQKGLSVRAMGWLMVGLYGLLLHGLLLAVILVPDLIDSIRWRLNISEPELTPFNRETAAHLLRRDGSLLPGRVLVVGDSHVQGLDVTRLHPHAVNFGIGGDTSLGLAQRLQSYRALTTAKALVIWIGTNDFAHRSGEDTAANIDDALTGLPDRLPVILVGVLPVDERLDKSRNNPAIRALNARLTALCRPPCRFIDPTVLQDATGQLDARFHEGDGVHLNEAGYARLSPLIAAAIAGAVEHR